MSVISDDVEKLKMNDDTNDKKIHGQQKYLFKSSEIL